ncbi:BEACH domain-containing protein B [Aristolochia californica]|uniref:BEACH domain-containing protein B n=1 Tax=Aristolochia californica TaxID=171875 RepID=UPI0035E272B4
MNIVKGVADLLRRTASGQPGDVASWKEDERLSVPSPKILFGEDGDEPVLSSLWRKYENSANKVEKKKLAQIFLMHFLHVYKNWQPVDFELASVGGSSKFSGSSASLGIEDVIVGCSAGHPAEVIIFLIREITRITVLVAESQSSGDVSGISVCFDDEGLHVLDALTIVIRSMHNRRVFGYYGGMQKLTALMKAAVIQLKSLTSAVATDEYLSYTVLEKVRFLQQMLLSVVSIIFGFIELNPPMHEKVQLHNNNVNPSSTSESACLAGHSSSTSGALSESKLEWQQKAIISVLEAGGLNWLVELLRVVKRLNLKELCTGISLQHLTLSTLKSALYENPRAQNHFRSIGGLEVLLDGLSLPSSSALASNNILNAENERDRNSIFGVFQLQVLSLEVLREAVFANLNNLQFLRENGRVHKFANNICWPAFMLQELQQQSIKSFVDTDCHTVILGSQIEVQENKLFLSRPSVSHQACNGYLRNWNEYVVKLSRVLCSFLLAPEDIEFHCVQASVGRTVRPVSFVYWELCIKWIMKVLLVVFPCIKACSSQNELPSHLRILANTLQHYILYTFRKVLVSSPVLLEVFRKEGIWDLIFSEKFFYFGPAVEGFNEETRAFVEEVPRNHEIFTILSENPVNPNEVEIIQMEVVSFVEFAATLNGNTHNLPECSVLLDALEQSACNPEIASILAKSLHRILQLSGEQTLVSFRTLDTATRVLKVSCIQAIELQRLRSLSSPSRGELSVETDATKGQEIAGSSDSASKSWIRCMEDNLELFTEYLSKANDAKKSVMHSAKCIDCLFVLFWEEELRKPVLDHILGLIKLPLSSEEDKTAKLQLYSKYLETFTRAKERECSFTAMAIDLLVGMRDVLLDDQMYYQDLFRDGECFLHIVSLLNGTLDKGHGEILVLNVLQTLTCLLKGNNASKAAFRSLVGTNYQTLQSLLLDVCQSQPSMELLNALLDMLVDGKFYAVGTTVIKNEDVIVLFLRVLQKSSNLLQDYGLDVFQQLLKDSITNRASCFRAGMLSFLLDWFAVEDNEDIIWKIAQLIQVIGGYSISGKDIRKIFALLRSEKIGSRSSQCSLLLSSIQSMLKVKGPTAFFEHSGNNSGIVIKTPLQWPSNKGVAFSCWVRVESFPDNGMMGLFSFLTENGRGCSAVLGNDKLIVEIINQKRQAVSLSLGLVRKKWHFLCLTHNIGRAFSGGSLLRCYVDGDLVSTEKCRYPKVNDLLTRCSIGTKVILAPIEESFQIPLKDTFSFHGQIGPMYLFGDALSSEQVKGIYSLGPSYMYSFIGNDITVTSDAANGIFDAKDGIASKIIFGLNAQASDGKALFNVSRVFVPTTDKKLFDAIILDGTQLCSRRMLQHIIYCVGGVSVFFPLLTQYDISEKPEGGQAEYTLLRSITRDRHAAEVIELIASVLDENPANQQQMHLLSGFSILGFLLRSVPPQQLNLEALSALKHLLNIVGNCGLSELLVKDAISSIYLNPHIWVYADYNVQRELYMFLIEYFETDPRLLTTLCRTPEILDIIHQFYWDEKSDQSAFGCKPLLHPVTGIVIGERPDRDEIQKIRLLLLSLAEMSLRQNIEGSDIKALVAFFERSRDMVCIEDVLHMVIRAVSQRPVLLSFLDQVNFLSGCHIFINLLQRDQEPIRLLGLQFLGKLLVGIPSEKKGPRFFNLTVGRTKSLSEGQKKAVIRSQPIFSAMSDRLFMFPLSDHLCATLFDVLLGGASPKQVLQKCSHPENQRFKKHGSSSFSSHFYVPQVLVLIFNFLSSCDDTLTRTKILQDLLDLLDSNLSSSEALMENGWNSWLVTSLSLDVLKNYSPVSQLQADSDKKNEQNLVRKVFCSVLSHYICSVKGGWQQLEETLNVLLLHLEQGNHSCQYLIRVIFEDIIDRLVEISSEESIFISQPCRDNTLFLLRLIDEMLISERGYKLPFPGNNFPTDVSPDLLELEGRKDFDSSVLEVLQGELENQLPRYSQGQRLPKSNANEAEYGWWNLYDKVWVLIGEMNEKGSGKLVSRSSVPGGPSFGQRARGLVESLNIPAAEMAAVVVSGGISTALSGKTNKYVDKAMLLRGEKCPRIIFRLVVLYICEADLERASRCIQQFILLLPCLLTADDEQSKSRLQLFIWSILTLRSQYGTLDDGARFHVISQLIRETVNCGKSMLATIILGKDDSANSAGNLQEAGTIHSLIQKDRLLSAVVEETTYMKISKSDRLKQLQELLVKMEENTSAELNQKKAFEDEIQANLTMILSSDEKRRSAVQLGFDEYQQVVAEKWVHMFRALIDERGPWSADSFPNCTVKHWKLDKTEDFWRRRPKLKRNYHFNEKLCRPTTASVSDNSHFVNEVSNNAGTYVPEKMKQILLKGIRGITEERNLETFEMDSEIRGSKASNEGLENQLLEPVKDNPGQEASVTSVTEMTDVLLSVPCVLVTPKRKIAGNLAIMHNVLHFFGEFLVEGTGGSSVFKSFSSSDSTKCDQLSGTLKSKLNKGALYPIGDDAKENAATISDIDSEVSLHGEPTKVKRYRRWNICKIRAVHWTRYLLRYTAIEIFFNDSVAPVFFNFAYPKQAKDVGTLIVSSRNDALFPKGSVRDRSGMISFVDRHVALEMAETARESWRRRDISNFEYLMILNTLGGRSYNDLTQYPVFPWVLADYSSEKLDFNKSSTFRDLSKPVGALDSKRFEVFEDRYRNFCDPDIPSFYFGSHYSSMGIVLYYLLRLEPCTALHRSLQGGKFDHADRLFQSIEGTYRNCLSNTSDVKELIPEFFYMPEFLVNSNSYHLGVKQDGDPLGDVTLPPWAKGSPEEFIHKNREALESEFVSSNLHHWIDLVFGYKQRGKPAVEAANVFYYLTYEGAVDLDTMEDDLQRAAIEDQIANFGQTPIQIFRKKHPRRGPPIPIAHPLYFAPASITLTSTISNMVQTPSAILFISLLDSNIVLVNQGLSMSVKMWVTTQLQSGGNFTFSGSQDPFFGVGPDVLSPRKIGIPLTENAELGMQCLATMQTPSENFLLSCGNWENSFQIISLNDGKMVQSIRQHKDVVSCIAVSSDGSVLATGSHDTTVMVWQVSRLRATEKRVRNMQGENPRKDSVIIENPFHILCGHDDIITCLFVSVELDIVISGSKDGTCIFHTLREGRYVRSVEIPSGSPLSKLAASRHGKIVCYSDNDLTLHLYSINGKHIATSESNGHLNCVELSSCGEFLVCAGDQGQIVVRSMHSLEVVRRYDGIGKMITALTVTPEECFLAGTKDGSILVYSIDNPQLRRSNVPRGTKMKASAVG